MTYYEFKISAENQAQADTILNSLLKKQLVTGGQFQTDPARFLWKGGVQDMPGYVTIVSYTTDKQKSALLVDVRMTAVEDVPMVTFTAIDSLSQELQDYIDQALGS